MTGPPLTLLAFVCVSVSGSKIDGHQPVRAAKAKRERELGRDSFAGDECDEPEIEKGSFY